MDKKIILLPFLFVFQIVIAQEISFTDGYYQNGLSYPIASLRGNPESEKAFNQNIIDIVSGYESQDYCIGQYGFVQKTNFIQLNFYFNCIDMDESKTEYHFFDLTDGQACSISAMFIDKQKKRYVRFFRECISQHILNNSNSTLTDEFIESISIDDCNVKLREEGMEISMSSFDNWPEDKLIITWSELRPFLKTTFI